MIPRLSPPITAADLAAAFRLPAGDDVPAFEHAFAALVGQTDAIAFPYGRTALMCLLEALDIRGREVLCPSYTCVVVPHAIVFSGNKPVFVDCDENSFLMSLDLAAEAVTFDTRAVIATSYFGEPVDLDRLAEFQAKFPDVLVIQDCAHSFSCEHRGRPVQKAGVAAIYGFNISKLISSIFGGMVTTDDRKLADRLRSVRDRRVSPTTVVKSISRGLYLLAVMAAFRPSVYPIVHKLASLGMLGGFARYYSEDRIDMPRDFLVGMSAIEARVGLSQTRRHPAIVEHHRHLAQRYLHELAGLPHLQLPRNVEGHTWSHFVVRTPAAPGYRRRGLSAGIEFGEVLEYHIPGMQPYRNCRHVNRGRARSYVGRVVNLPIHTGVDDADAARIIDFLRQPS